MNYQELSDMLQELDESQMKDIAVVLVDDEPYEVTNVAMQEGINGPVQDGTCFIEII